MVKMSSASSSFSGFSDSSTNSSLSTVSNKHQSVLPINIPIRLIYVKSNGESENSGSTFVTPQQKRRRPTHGLPTKHPPYNRRNRKVSAPPQLQAHLGQKSSTLPTFNFTQASQKGSSNPDSAEHTTELIINLNNSGKLGLPEGLNSGSDSGVPSEYSSWAAPVGSHFDISPPYEDVHPLSITGSLEDIPSAAALRQREYISDSEDEDMSSPQANYRNGEEGGHTNPGFVNSETQQKPPLVLAVNGPPPPPLTRAQTDTNLLNSNNTNSLPIAQDRGHARPRRNSMVFQLNLANGVLGSPNMLPNARSVSMVSLNTAGNGPTNLPITYPNLNGFQTDNQSIYSDAGIPASYSNPGFLGLGNNLHGSQASLSGVGYGYSGVMNNNHQNFDDDQHEAHHPEATDPEYRQKWFVDTLCENLSTIYAILLFMIGCVLYMADTFSKQKSAMGETFNVYLILAQLFWLGYIHIDVRKYINSISSALEEAKKKEVKGDPVQLETTTDGQYQLRINLPEPKKIFAQHYGFTSGRHGGSLYLKIGAAVFSLGYLIHSGLNLGQKFLFFVEDDPKFDSCTCTQDILMSILQPIYAFYQLFFIFKYSNLIINRRKRLSKFALMHCISSSLLFWVYTIIQETLQAISSKNAAYPSNVNDSSVEMNSEEDDDDDSKYEQSSDYEVNYGCGMTTNLTTMINNTTPYLYPFSIEYNILIVGIWILLWENIGRMDRHTHLPSIEMTYEDDNTKGITSNMIIYVDCHSSNRGLFAGLLMTVATIISIILFFIFTSNDKTKEAGLQVNGYSEIIILFVMIIVVIMAHSCIRNLDIVKSSVSQVDDILLYICLPCIFLYSTFNMLPAITYGKPLFVVVSIMKVIQAILQTTLICDGLRRCSNSARLNTKKPGRELITFLIVANIALWLLETFEIKSEEGNSYKYKFYGPEAWTLLSHMTLPLSLFYRFHSSVCLVDIWKGGYEVEAEH